jgi:Tfp pilus assembly protein PilW
MTCRQFTHSCSADARLQQCGGFTVLEMMVAAVLGIAILFVALQTAESNQQLQQLETVRTRINQNLRSGLDIIGMNIRQAGERLERNFPAVEVIDGGGSAPDQLILRRNLLDDWLNVCQAVVPSPPALNIYFAVAGSAVKGCVFSSQESKYASWKAYREAEVLAGNSVSAFIYDTVLKVGEFFPYSSEVESVTQTLPTRDGNYTILTESRPWLTTYAVGSASIYLIEEYRFQVADQYLELVTNQEDAAARRVVFGVSSFDITLTMADGTTKTSFARTDDWSQIRSINISMTGEEGYRGRTISKVLSAQFFPRNVLSL